MKRSDSITEIAKALAEFHAEITNPVKDKIAQVRSDKGNYSYGFSDLADATNLARPVLAKCGLSITQELITEIPNKVGARSTLMHVSGEWIEYEPVFVQYTGGPQQMGSAATYGRRYSYLAVLSLAPDDDDAANAQGAYDSAHKAPEPPKPEAVHEQTLAHLRMLRLEFEVTDDTYAEQLEKVGGVSLDTDLTQVAAKTLVGVYERRRAALEKEAKEAAKAAEKAVEPAPEPEPEPDPEPATEPSDGSDEEVTF